MNKTGKVGILATVTATAILLAGCSSPATGNAESSKGSNPPPAASSKPGQSGGSGSVVSGDAAETVLSLTVKGRAPKTGYSREQFGSSWVDVDDNNCNTRDDMLRRDLTELVPPSGCEVSSGVLVDPYGGETIVYERGRSLVDIDHVVALSDAWQKGAFQWSYAKRVAFANDPGNLLSVSASLNRQKGDGDTATWLPPAKSYRCAYVARQAAVKAKYGVWVTKTEQEAMLDILSECPGEPLPDLSSGPVEAPGVSGNGPSTPSTNANTVPGSGKDYGSCAAAKAAGEGPYRKGIDPEYGFYRDADGDGIVCE